MPRDDTVAGSKTSARNPRGVIVDKLSKPVGTTPQRGESVRASVEQHCGAMSQQRCDSGAISTPQQFVHLVGCRDRKKGQQQR